MGYDNIEEERGMMANHFDSSRRDVSPYIRNTVAVGKAIGLACKEHGSLMQLQIHQRVSAKQRKGPNFLADTAITYVHREYT